jgi:hypothetical protein
MLRNPRRRRPRGWPWWRLGVPVVLVVLSWTSVDFRWIWSIGMATSFWPMRGGRHADYHRVDLALAVDHHLVDVADLWLSEP